MCKVCNVRPRYGVYTFCRKCALTKGWRSCSVCTRLFMPDEKRNWVKRCPKCVAEKRRKAGKGGS